MRVLLFYTVILLIWCWKGDIWKEYLQMQFIDSLIFFPTALVNLSNLLSTELLLEIKKHFSNRSWTVYFHIVYESRPPKSLLLFILPKVCCDSPKLAHNIPSKFWFLLKSTNILVEVFIWFVFATCRASSIYLIILTTGHAPLSHRPPYIKWILRRRRRATKKAWKNLQ